MDRVRNLRSWKLAVVLALVVFFLIPIHFRAGGKDIYEESEERANLPNRSLTLKCAKPLTPRSPRFLVIFASGDGGLRGVSKAVYKYIADQGHYVAAYSSPEMLKPAKSSGKLISFSEAAADIMQLMRESKRLLGLPESTPTIVSGMSRGASMVVFASGQPSLQQKICGAVAIALTRESDYIQAPAPAQRSGSIQLDEEGRILLYPALERLGSIPIAVIQSTNDNYVSSAESRSLMGPDTPTRRLYEVKARNHSFGGGEDEMLRNVDEALNWIAEKISAPPK